MPVWDPEKVILVVFRHPYMQMQLAEEHGHAGTTVAVSHSSRAVNLRSAVKIKKKPFGARLRTFLWCGPEGDLLLLLEKERKRPRRDPL